MAPTGWRSGGAAFYGPDAERVPECVAWYGGWRGRVADLCRDPLAASSDSRHSCRRFAGGCERSVIQADGDSCSGGDFPQDASVTHGEKARTTTVSGRLAADREASGRERRALVTGALALIEEHPLSGHGIGSFESVFPAALARSGYQDPFPVTVAHPHNEILYAWS